MRSLSSAITSALASSSVRIAQLVEMQLTQPLRLNTSPWDLAWSGNTWFATYGLGRIDPIEDSPGELKGLRFELSGVPSTVLATALSEPIQGKPINIYTAVFDAQCQILDVLLDWSGRLDTMPIAEDGERATIAVTAEHIGVDLLRPAGINFSHQDQGRLHPGDQFFEYVIDQSDQQVVWPAAAFFRQ